MNPLTYLQQLRTLLTPGAELIPEDLRADLEQALQIVDQLEAALLHPENK